MEISVSSFLACDFLLWPGPVLIDPGEPAVGRVSRAATLYSVGSMSDPDHEAAIRFSGEAPRWRAHSALGFEAMAVFGSPPPRIIISDLCANARRMPKLGVFRSCSIKWFKRQPAAARHQQGFLRSLPVATGRSAAFGQAPRSLSSYASQQHLRFGLGTTAPGRCPSESAGSATPVE
jgi:hypothetical protein